MKCKALDTIRANGMLRKGHVLLALSGGADSMALLHLLLSLQKEFDFVLEAAHINHGIRGEQADADEKFVVDACNRLNVPIHILHADIPAECERTGEGTEECGRRIRYAYLTSLCKGEIATAHTLSDSAETVLLHLARGSGIQGLCGITAVRDNIIRPLIHCTRDEIERYCEDNSIEYITDETNLTDAYTRNRIRHHVVPELKSVNPAFERAADRCTSLLSSDADYLSQQTRALLESSKIRFGFDALVLKQAHPAIRTRAIAQILRETMLDEPQMHQIKLCEELLFSNGKVQASGDITACVYGGVFYIERKPLAEWRVSVDSNCVKLPFGYAKISFLNKENIQFVHKHDLANCLCCDTILGNVLFRSRAPGDAMHRVHSGCTKPIKKLFQEQKIPDCFRNEIPILSDGEQILWIEGIGPDEKYAVTEKSEKIMRIDIIRE